MNAKILSALLMLTLVACSSPAPTGRFEGHYTLAPYLPNGSAKPARDEFIYRPDERDPFRFVCSDGTVIQPQAMWTDGGSVPRLISWVPGFGRWHYERSYIIHDWLTTAHRVQQPPREKTVPTAVEEIFEENLNTEAKDKHFHGERLARSLIAHFANHGRGALGHWNARQPDPLRKWER